MQKKRRENNAIESSKTNIQIENKNPNDSLKSKKKHHLNLLYNLNKTIK